MIEQQIWVCKGNIHRFQERLRRIQDDSGRNIIKNILAFEELERRRLVRRKKIESQRPVGEEVQAIHPNDDSRLTSFNIRMQQE